MRNWKKPLGLVPEITLITLLSADPIRFGNEKAFITGILASATVHFAMAICFYANLESLSPSFPDSSVLHLQYRAFISLVSKEVYSPSGKIFQNTASVFYLGLFFPPVCIFPFYHFCQTFTKHSSGFLWVFMNFGWFWWPGVAKLTHKFLYSCYENLGWNITDGIDFRSWMFFYLNFHAPIDENHIKPSHIV